jgi:stringent starvation protein B
VEVTMTSSRPYLVRALNDWILDNDLTPYLVVDAGIKGVQVPDDFVSNGQIVLNVSPRAVQNLNMEDDAIQFSARFGGVPMTVFVPMMAIIAVYAKENGQGMVFGSEPGSNPPPDSPETRPQTSSKQSKNRPSLKVVK